jgi:RNA polymerase sigma-70 factor, ECF subfamily
MGAAAHASLSPDDVQRALGGDRGALRVFVDALTPTIQARVARTLLRRRPHGPARDIRQEVEDLCQQVFVSLFANEAKALRAWDPERGLPLNAFVGLLAEREVNSVLRSQRRNPWTDDPTDDQQFDTMTHDDMGPEQSAASREMLRALLGRLRESLSDRGMQIFLWLFVDGRSVDDVCAMADMNADAVYAWRSRLGKQVRALAAEMMSDSGAQPRRNQESEP